MDMSFVLTVSRGGAQSRHILNADWSIEVLTNPTNKHTPPCITYNLVLSTLHAASMRSVCLYFGPITEYGPVRVSRFQMSKCQKCQKCQSVKMSLGGGGCYGDTEIEGMGMFWSSLG